ncbi:unnamed protein product [Clavelina lepadiformis]|uniref:Uncharacterized protein n=1 Tax=Clavelina lepadiformis TaxID=159417 RepID=A0ABP0GA05_CLALP
MGRFIFALLLVSVLSQSARSQCGDNYLAFFREKAFFSPNYPFDYPNNADCEWTITTRNAQSIKLRIDDFNTQPEKDYLEIIEGGMVTTLSGSASDPIPYVSVGPRVTIRFRSDNSITATGFLVAYKSVPGQPCRELLTATNETKILMSPGYPNRYQSGRYCYWTIKSETGKHVQIKFTDAKIHEEGDYIEIFDGVKRLGQINETLDTVRSFTSLGDTMTIYFHTNQDENLEGFMAQYKEVPCGGEYYLRDDAIQELSSPGYPHSSVHNLDCLYTLHVELGMKIKMTLDVDTEKDSDYVEVQDGEVILGRYDGYQRGINITSSGNKLILRYHTDDKATSAGFHATYHQTGLCQNKLSAVMKGKMYQLIKERLSREDAVEACRSRGMNDRPALLANVHDRATQTCMREMIMSDGVYDPADWADQPSKFLVGVWIGLNDIDVENQFVWTDGTKLEADDYTNWGGFEPNNVGRGQDCVSMMLQKFNGNYEEGTWVDTQCNAEQFYFCEKDFDECAANTHNCHEHALCLNTDEGFTCVCKDGYTGDGINCRTGCTGQTSAVVKGMEYRFFKTRVTYQEAKKRCALWDRKSILASIHDRTTQQCVDEMIGSDDVYNPDDWTDLTSPYDRGVWIGGNDIEDENRWLWEDGSLMPLPTDLSDKFRNWGMYEPNNYLGNQDCAFALMANISGGYVSGSWLDSECDKREFYMCQRGVCTGKTSTIFKGNDYRFFPTRVTFPEARARCQNLGENFRLAMIRDNATQTCITQMITSEGVYEPNEWTDLTSPYDHGVWIGGSDMAREGKWAWEDGSLMPNSSESKDFQKWGKHEPNNYLGEQDCALASLRYIDEDYPAGSWLDSDCDHREFYVCKKDLNECMDNTHNCDKNALCINTEGSFTCICKEGYTGDGVTCKGLCEGKTSEIIKGHKYMLFQRRASYLEARRKCKDWGLEMNVKGSLAKIEDMALQICLNQMITSEGVFNPDDWLDLVSPYDRGVWIGGNDMKMEGDWLWEDGSKMPLPSDLGKMQNWGKLEPNNYGGNQDCALSLLEDVNEDYTAGTWMDAECGFREFYFCQSDIDECSTNLHNCHEHARCINTEGSFTCECKEGYIGDGVTCTGICLDKTNAVIGGREYQFFQTRLSYQDAKEECKRWGGYTAILASIHDLTTQACISQMITSEGVYKPEEWTNLTSPYDQGAWIGGNDIDFEGFWIWEDGSIMPSFLVKYFLSTAEKYDNWGALEPNNYGGDQDCAFASLRRIDEGYPAGSWVDNIDECSASIHNCHEHAHCVNTDGHFACICNMGYTGDGVNCTAQCIGKTSAVVKGNEYRLFKTRIPYQMANEQCKRWGQGRSGILATVHDVETQTCITQMITSEGIDNPDDWLDLDSPLDKGFWIGGNDIDVESNWVWEDGRPMPSSSASEKYENWALNEPNNFRDNQNCAVTLMEHTSDNFPAGSWVDIECDYDEFYICQRDIDECKLNMHNCHENAVCTNTNGSFICTCKQGFTGDGITCLAYAGIDSGESCVAKETVTLGGKVYQLFKNKTSFAGSQTVCLEWGGESPACTAIIHDRHIQSCLADMITSEGVYDKNDWGDVSPYGVGVWLGASDSSYEGNWHWLDGEPVPLPEISDGFQNWGRLEPNLHGENVEDCASMLLIQAEDYPPATWVDSRCAHSQFFICEKDIDECKENKHNCHEDAECLNTYGSFACVCKDGFTGDGLMCESRLLKASTDDCSGKTSALIKGEEYRLFLNRMSYKGAKEQCANWGGHLNATLAIIRDQATQTCINQMITSEGVYKPDEWMDLSSKYDQGAWIGGNDIEREQYWVWEDGSPMPSNSSANVGFENWGMYEPNNYRGDQNCAFTLLRHIDDSYPAGSWLDNECDFEEFFLCQRDFDECTADTHNCHKDARCLNTAGSFMCVCKDGFTGDGLTCTGLCSGKTSAVVEGHEYQLFQTRTNYRDAKQRCINWGGVTNATLAMIRDEPTQTCITQMMTSDGVYKPDEWTNLTNPSDQGAWMGANDIEMEGIWVWEDGTLMVIIEKYLYFDECAANTHNCDQNALCINTEGSFTCICKEGYTGDGVTCTAMCRGKRNVTLSGKEYHLIREKLTYFDANEGCKRLAKDLGDSPGRLASIHSSETQTCFDQMITSDGVYDEDDWSDADLYHRGVWIGGDDIQFEGTWRWQDGTPMPGSKTTEDFQNWAPHDPDNLGSSGEDCASMLLATIPDDSGYVPGKWVDIDCSTSAIYYMCERDVDECSLYTHDCDENALCTNTVGSFKCVCKEGYTGDGVTCENIALRAEPSDCTGKTSAIIEGMEYQLFQNRQTFQDARGLCTNWGGGIDAELAIIKKQSTQTCITQMITSDGVYKPEEWIDETEPYNRGAWIGASDMRSESNWVWEDGTLLKSDEFENWGLYEPNNYKGEQDCAFAALQTINDGYPGGSWIDSECNNREFYVCQRDYDECSTNQNNCHEHALCINTEGSFTCICKDGYTGDGVTCKPLCSGKKTVTLSGKQYHLVRERQTFYNAREGCRRLAENLGDTPGRLASVFDLETQTCFDDMITSDGVYNEDDWRGVDLYHRGVWIGGNDVQFEGRWRWQDGTPMPSSNTTEDFQNWAPHDPDNLGLSGEDCASMLLATIPDDNGYIPGKWVDIDCSASAIYYMCERDYCWNLKLVIRTTASTKRRSNDIAQGFWNGRTASGGDAPPT